MRGGPYAAGIPDPEATAMTASTPMHATPTTGRLRLVGTLALLWNLVGVAMFWLQVTLSPASLAALPEAQRAVHAATPGWVNVAFGLAVATGVIGAMGLLRRRAWAVPAFGVSLLALLVQLVGAYAVTPAWASSGAAGLVLPVLLVVIAAALWRYAARARRAGALH